MSIPEHDLSRPVGEQTVPDALLGCWRRNWIRFGDDGPLERDVTVIWLQTASGMGDLRIDPGRPATATDSSCGVTVVDQSTEPYMTADWLDGDSGFSQQPVPSFPEKGLLKWQDDRVLHELAPSGAYVEQWERLPGSDGVVSHYRALGTPTSTNLYVSGIHVFLAVERQPDHDLHEFSYGVRSPGEQGVQIRLSTMATRFGQALALDLDWELVSGRTA